MTADTSVESMLLCVRAVGDLGAALTATGQILAQRRRNEPHLTVEIHGVWVDERLDEGLISPQRGLAPAEGGRQPGDRTRDAGEAVIDVREATTLAGVWTLCSFDGASLRAAPGFWARQEIVLDAVVGAHRSLEPGRDEGQYFPVFPATIAPDAIRDGFRRLRARHPGVVGQTWFLFKNEHGTPEFKPQGLLPVATSERPLVAVIMGSKRDWPTMSGAVEILAELGIPYEAKVVSAHRTPDLLFDYVGSAEQRGIQVIVAGAGGAAHLPGMAAAKTTLPVLGVPIGAGALNGVDSLLSIVQMPRGVPVGTLSIGAPGAANAALLAASVIALGDSRLQQRLKVYRARQTAAVLEEQL